MTADDLLDLPPAELRARAAQVRDRHTGTRITYSPKVFIPLTMLCRDRCGYCTFAKAPARLSAPYLSPDEVLADRPGGGRRRLLRGAVHPRRAARGAVPGGRRMAGRPRVRLDGGVPGGRVPAGRRGDRPAPPRQRRCPLAPMSWPPSATVSASQGMMIESLNAGLACHRGAPDKDPERRLATLESAGRLGIPFTTGHPGRHRREPRRSDRRPRRRSPNPIGDGATCKRSSSRTSCPRPGTAMHLADPCDPGEYLWSIAAARVILPPDVHLQAPPNLSDAFGELLSAGIDDWGGVSPVTADHVNPERPWPALEQLRAVTEAAGFTLAPRLTIYPGVRPRRRSVARRGDAVPGARPQRRRGPRPGAR